MKPKLLLLSQASILVENMRYNTKGIIVHGPRDSIFKENTIQQCTCTVSIILAISIKVLARALSFSETLYAAFRFSF